jgi:hypothetical protein
VVGAGEAEVIVATILVVFVTVRAIVCVMPAMAVWVLVLEIVILVTANFVDVTVAWLKPEQKELATV